MSKVKPIDYADYANIGKVEQHDSTASIVEKMISKTEQTIGKHFNKEEPVKAFNLKGIVDDRKKEFWSPPKKP